MNARALKAFVPTKLLPLLLLLALPAAAQAQSGYYSTAHGTVYYTVINGATITIQSYVGSDTALGIPSTINVSGQNYPVTIIGTQAFARNQSLTSVSLPNSVTTIGSQAFL